MIALFVLRAVLFVCLFSFLGMLGIVQVSPVQANIANPSPRVQDPMQPLSLNGSTTSFPRRMVSEIAEASEGAGLWDSFGFGVDTTINDIALQGSNIFIGGGFSQVCGNSACNANNVTVNYVAKWDGSSWSTLGYGLNGSVYDILATETDLFVGGSFTEACGNSSCDEGSVSIHHIAKWSGSSWVGVGDGLDDSVYSLAMDGSDLYAAGGFTQACGNVTCDSGNVVVNRIAKWNGSTWSALGNGVNYYPNVVEAGNGMVYLAGWFNQICGNEACDSNNVAVNRIAQWNGTNWSSIGFGVEDEVYTLLVNGDDLYAGGNFDYVCGNAACDSGNLRVNSIAKWDGTSWSGLGYGFSYDVSAIAMNEADLYVGGIFLYSCGNPTCDSGNITVNRLAKWNGTQWTNVDSGVNYPITALVLSSQELYVGGAFKEVCGNNACNAGNTVVNHLAKRVPCTTKPGKPLLQAPANNASTNKTRPTLKWNAATCADTYNVTIKDAATGNKVDTKTGLAKLQYKTKTLTQNKTYKWFVQACNDLGCTKSKAWTFTVQ